MKENTRFYYCKECGNIIGLIKGDAKRITCCGETVIQLVAHEEINEKHTPKYEKVENEIFVTLNHPMTKEHYIEWIALMTDTKTIRVRMYPEQNAECRFPYIPNSKIFAYCNQHGLWCSKVN